MIMNIEDLRKEIASKNPSESMPIVLMFMTAKLSDLNDVLKKLVQQNSIIIEGQDNISELLGKLNNMVQLEKHNLL